jgi:hypothetical protein
VTVAACKFPYPADVPGVEDGAGPDAAEPIDGADARPPKRWGLLAADARTVNNNASEPLRFYIREESGAVASTWTSVELDWGRSVAWADVDADGDDDFAVGNGFGTRTRNRIYRNDGNTFTLIWTAATPAGTRTVRWADVDRDGDLDLVAAIDHGVRVHRSTDGAFSESDAIDTPFHNVYGIDVADMDSGGNQDIAVATSAGPFVYASNGTGVHARSWRGPVEDGTSVRRGDYDRDGDQDLAFGFTYGLQVLQQTGGAFVRAFHSGADHDPGITALTADVDWLDFDGDQDLDMVAAHCQFPSEGGACMPAANRIYRNTGGTFSVGWIAADHDLSQSVAVADVSGDGKPDLASGNNGPNRIYEHLGSSFVLAWTSPKNENTAAVEWAPLPP